MKIVKYVKYFDITIRPEGHIHRWTVPRKNSFNVSPRKLMHPQKVWLRDCVTLKSMSSRFCELDWIHIRVQTTQPSMLRHMPYTALLQASTMSFATSSLCVETICDFGPDLLGIHSISLAARYRTAAKFEDCHRRPREDSDSSCV